MHDDQNKPNDQPKPEAFKERQARMRDYYETTDFGF